MRDVCENRKADECSFKSPVVNLMWINYDRDVYIVGNSHWGADYYGFEFCMDEFNEDLLRRIKERVAYYLKEDKVYYGVDEVLSRKLEEKGYRSVPISIDELTAEYIETFYKESLSKGGKAFSKDANVRMNNQKRLQRRNEEYCQYMNKVR